MIVRFARDLSLDGNLHKVLVSAAAGLLYVEPQLVFGVIFILALNLVASVWLAFERESIFVCESLIALLRRFLVYLLIGIGVVVLSAMLADLQVLRTLYFAGVGGWELGVLMATCARLVPSFRPVYIYLLKTLNDVVPIDLQRQELEDHLDQRRKEKEEAEQ